MTPHFGKWGTSPQELYHEKSAKACYKTVYKQVVALLK
ncbi:hypothetical protein F3D3_1226 [Fusibacter sp. 3D3]|nr:hypothetical protein F3D3_1226 [Fusibacter sp. 3D3]